MGTQRTGQRLAVLRRFGLWRLGALCTGRDTMNDDGLSISGVLVMSLSLAIEKNREGDSVLNFSPSSFKSIKVFNNMFSSQRTCL